MSLEALVYLSRKYGADPNFVIAGGGNTSYKDNSTLYIKGSGTSLASITASDFVRMDRRALERMWHTTYPVDEAERERIVLQDLMNARLTGEDHKRPSVETMLHDLLPFAYVVHTHPAIVNGLTCSLQGEAYLRELFGEDPLWIPITNPGYMLSLRVKKELDLYKSQHHRAPQMIFLQNHGVFVAADSPEGIEAQYQRIIETISQYIKRFPESIPILRDFGPSKELAALLAKCPFPANYTGSMPNSRFICFRRDLELATRTQNKENFKVLLHPFTPDHIVYAGSDPLFLDLKLTEQSTISETLQRSITDQWMSYISMFNRLPKIIAVSSLGIFGLGSTERAAELAAELMADAAKVACYAESFGGPRHMEQEYIDFINNWEVEHYRSTISTK
uniref:Class II aldolase n=1 Tax=Gracilinema caldarium TaxID=215591 RepID=A0A7C3E3I9_9SPIR